MKPKHFIKNKFTGKKQRYESIDGLLGLVKANNPSKQVLATFGSLCAHKPIAATVSAANLLSESLT